MLNAILKFAMGVGTGIDGIVPLTASKTAEKKTHSSRQVLLAETAQFTCQF